MLITLASLLTTAVAIAISPLAIVAVILFATNGKGRTNGTAFVVGSYVIAVLFIGIVVLLGRDAGADVEGSGPNLALDALQILLGIALLVMAVLQWSKRASTEKPKWLQKLDSMNFWRAFGLGVLIYGLLSPKNLPLYISAGGRISQADLTREVTVAVVLIFGAMSVAAILVPWLISVFAPSRTEQWLGGMREWLIANNAVIMAILFVILGFKLIGTGLADLLIASEV